MKKLRYWFKSLRFQIFLLLLIFGIAPGFFLRAGFLSAYERRAVELQTSDITSQAKLLATQIAANDYLEKLSRQEYDDDSDMQQIFTQLDQMSTMYDGRILLINSAFKIVEDTYQMDENRLLLTRDVMRAHRGETVQTYDNEYYYIEVILPIADPDSSAVLGEMMVSVSTDSIELNLLYLRQRALMLQLLLNVVVIVIGFALSGTMTKPFKRLAKSVRDVHDGYENDFKGVDVYSETAAISEACNGMLRRLQMLDETRQEFVSNVSHELKTPLASMKVLADSLIGQEDVPVEFYREFMSDIGEEIDRESKIIDDLLSLVKMDKTSANVNITSVNINELLELIMKRLRPIARKKNVDLILESFRPVMAEVDEMKLTLALSNLIENAIKYNHPEGWVRVSLNADHQNFFVTVEDNGIGIPEEDQEHIFERFYRVDKSHSREIGGTGLGLAIARDAIILHRGAIRVYSKEGEGTTFTVRIPLNYIEG